LQVPLAIDDLQRTHSATCVANQPAAGGCRQIYHFHGKVNLLDLHNVRHAPVTVAGLAASEQLMHL
jgi:hypothetical protein